MDECAFFHVSVVLTGAAALESLAGGGDLPRPRPPMEILDYYMPDMCGMDVLRSIRL